jgi:hypothetical protein
MKPVIKKIEFSKEELEEIDKINKGIPIPRVKTVTNKNGYTYEYTTNKRFTFETARKRLRELYKGLCTTCGDWPNYIISRDVGDKTQGATLIERYCQSCSDKWQERINK